MRLHELAASAADPAVRQTLLALAHQEAKRKLRSEIEYDEQVLTENRIGCWTSRC